MPAFAQSMLMGWAKCAMASDIESWMDDSEVMSPWRQYRLGLVAASGFERRSCAVTLQPCAVLLLVVKQDAMASEYSYRSEARA